MMRYVFTLLLGMAMGASAYSWRLTPMVLPLTQPQTLIITAPVPDGGNHSAARNPVKTEYLAVMSGYGRTSVVLVYAGEGFFALQTLDGGMVTGQIGRFHPGLRIARYGARPAGWTIGSE